MKFFRHPLLTSVLLLICTNPQASDAETWHSFRTLLLSEEFHSEGVCVADINGDGQNDIVSGPYWYQGPQFRKRTAFTTPKTYSIKGYSDFFLTFADDFNGDGRVDILVVGTPGEPAYWFENPPDVDNTIWKRYLAVRGVGDESPTFSDLTGDGNKELVFIQNGAFGYAGPDRANPDREWEFVPISGDLGVGRFTHGLGVADINGDGRSDLLETNGWWEQTAAARSSFRFHRQRFAVSGGAQMFAFDIDGDGDNDVISTQNAHAYGLSWFEQTATNDGISFIEHPILTDSWQDNDFGLAISQMHAVGVADVDGDGISDIVTGKRYWAHGGNDPGAREANVLYWFRTVRPTSADGEVQFEPHLIDNRSGVGTQLAIADVSGDGLADIVVGNKLGTFVARHETHTVTPKVLEALRPKPLDAPAHVIGTSLFNENVRTTSPVSPEQQQSTFVLPKGFSIDLVAANPTIGQPMNLAFDGRGRLWVSSSLEYPFGAAKEDIGRDTITIFEDTNHDGQFDKTTKFADGLDIPIGLLPYKSGVVCFSIPNIWYLEDTDGDDRADKRTVLYGPFDTTRDRHGMCNAFTRGLDGWVYACHGFSNQSTVSGADGHTITMRSGNTFRFRLDGSRIEHFTHGQVNPFGIAVDRYGDILTADCHTKPINLLLRYGYHDSFGAPHDGLGYTPNVMEHLHGSTGIGGIALGEHTTFPDVYRNSTFGCNVVTSRVNRNTLIRNGSSIRAREESDFLTSSDPWFRPVYNIVGPDGALYIADFYNAIIGHYEVDLHHPKRDRELGRVWRVSYNPTDDRRDPQSTRPRQQIDLTVSSLGQLIEVLASDNEIQARLAMDQITDRFPNSSAALRRALSDASELQQVRLFWCLHRVGQLDFEDIAGAASAESDILRVHAMRMLEAQESNQESHVQLLLQGFNDNQPLVQRAAVMASATHLHAEFVRPLMSLQERAPLSDAHLRHGIKISLGRHLKDEDRFQELIAGGLPEEQERTIADLCGFLSTKQSGRFLIEYVSKNSSIENQRLKTYLKTSARHIDETSAAAIIDMIRKRFPGDTKLQLELLNGMRVELSSQSQPIPPAIRNLAEEIATELFVVRPSETVSPAQWSAIRDRAANDTVQRWGISTTRSSADGMQNTPLWSSFVNGEEWTGTFRSTPFIIPESISFYVAGHDGTPSAPPQKNNYVELRDAESGAVLRTASPKRNDTAQLVQWDTSDIAGRRAFISLVDRDTGAAYAWMAVGRFSISELNPSLVPQRHRQAAAIVRDFGLSKLQDQVAHYLSLHANDPTTCKELAKSLAALPDSHEQRTVKSALAETMDFTAMNVQTRRQVANVILGANSDGTVLSQLMKSASSGEQVRVADILCRTAAGARLLLQMVERGEASARLLVAAKRNAILQQSLTRDGIEKLASLTDGVDLPAESAAKAIANRRQHYATNAGSAASGRVIFEKQCMTCHQVGNQGKAFAPNLDGIGSRGLDRLLEDVLDPNRNVDVAFRAQTIVTRNGQVYNGLIKDAGNNQVLLIEATGVERLINADDIEEKTPSNLSPMPANFGELLTEKQFSDLISYLLSLTNS